MCLSLTNDSYHISLGKKKSLCQIHTIILQNCQTFFFFQIKESLVAWNSQCESGWSWIWYSSCLNFPSSGITNVSPGAWLSIPDWWFIDWRLIGWLVDGYKLAHRDFLLLLNWDFSSSLQPSNLANRAVNDSVLILGQDPSLTSAQAQSCVLERSACSW